MDITVFVSRGLDLLAVKKAVSCIVNERIVQSNVFLVGWDSRIHQLHPCRGVKLLYNVCPGYDTKQSDGEVLLKLELWGM